MKIICIYGPGSTGKTSAINAVLQKVARVGLIRGDILAIVEAKRRIKIKKKHGLRDDYAFGVGSRGDNFDEVRHNFDFMSKYRNLDYIHVLPGLTEEPKLQY